MRIGKKIRRIKKREAGWLWYAYEVKFNYTASQENGALVRGTMEAASESAMLDFLARKNLQPVSLVAAPRAPSIFARRINATDAIFLTKYLALMLRAGTDLFRALDILIADFEKPAMKSFLLEVRESLERGQPFYTAFARHSYEFEPVFVSLVKAGEMSGNLEHVFNDLSIMLAKREDLRRKITAALIYPAILLVASLGIVVFLATFALPNIADVFGQAEIAPPFFVASVFAVSKFIAGNLIALGISAGVLIIGSWFFFFHTRVGRRYLNAILRRTPVVRRVIQQIAIQRFAATLGKLLSAGLPIIDSLELTATAVGHYDFEVALQRIAREGVARGASLGDSFRKEPAFPLVITTLIAVSEKAGHLDEVLETLSVFYESEIDSAVKSMVALIEPIMLICLGGIVGLVAMSVIIPIYQLVGSF